MERLCGDDRGLRLLEESRDRIGFLAEIPSYPRRLVKSARSFFEREEDISGDRVVKVLKEFGGGFTPPNKNTPKKFAIPPFCTIFA